ncbi:host-nuclease inhibitor Gam family protein [Roseibium sp. SCP14]|uniref:host-nuclease inhibitor Gam family protein n=1 Tax=Roseibium sp. SCP14 TaxID=3141375 RepID=UPI0033357B09
MSRNAKAKRLAANYPVPQSKEDCDEMIRVLGDVRRELARTEADMNDKLAETKETFEKKAEPLRDKAEELLSGIETWCAANRDKLTQNGKVKFAKLKNGEIRWRVRPRKVNLRAVDAVIERLKELGLKRFIRTKEEVNKEAILEDQEAVKGVKGISIGSEGEDFVVEPFEAALNEKAA